MIAAMAETLEMIAEQVIACDTAGSLPPGPFEVMFMNSYPSDDWAGVPFLAHIVDTGTDHWQMFTPVVDGLGLVVVAPELPDELARDRSYGLFDIDQWALKFCDGCGKEIEGLAHTVHTVIYGAEWWTGTGVISWCSARCAVDRGVRSLDVIEAL